eukprot:jgi/Chrzof1/8478/Cz03g12050.t1
MAQTRGQKRAYQEGPRDDGPCGSSGCASCSNKRARYNSDTAEQTHYPRSLYRASQQVLRPGIPYPIRLSSFRLPDKPSPPLRGDDKEGHYVYELGENISSRYKILSKFGEGTFGRVLECWDRKTNEYVAVKIVKNVEKYRHAAMIELEVLNTLEHNDPQTLNHCVKLKEWFDYRGHVCMVFEKLGPSLYDFLRRNDYQPFPMCVVQHVAQQLLEAVAYMHELNLVHTDLKPENILLTTADYFKIPSVNGSHPYRRVPNSGAIRVIDFGSATFEDGYHSSVVSTRHYRAPEVILGLGWSFPCDIWSVGCILVELASGDALFQTHESLEHLAMMQQVLGELPEHMVYRADKQCAKYFVRGRLNWPDGATSKKSLRSVRRLADLHTMIVERCEPGARAHATSLADLVTGMLRCDPSSRITAAEALRHSFCQVHIEPPKPAADMDGLQCTPEPAGAGLAVAGSSRPAAGGTSNAA